ncbi:MAG: hypothetical protein Q9177_000502 [Variospora cf. flavescens]
MDSPAILCARFLKANNYEDTLKAFLAEAGLPSNAGSTEPGDLTIEKVLGEKQVFDLSLAFERSSIAGSGREWSFSAPTKPLSVETPSLANFLHVSMEHICTRADDPARQILFASTADRRMRLFDPCDNFAQLRSLNDIHDSPILSCTTLSPPGTVTVTASMSGQVVLYDHSIQRILDERKDHKKYVVKVTHFMHEGSTWVATAGWDAKIFLYRLRGHTASATCSLGEPVASVSLTTNPETIAFLTCPDAHQPMLLITRRDSTSLHYYCVEDQVGTSPPTVVLRLLGSQNLAPHSNAWISFSPSSVAICPIDPYLLAVATSAVPHMKLIIVRPLIPPPSSSEAKASAEPTTQASQSRRKLAIQEQEDDAIKVHVSTFAPQTPYSTPQVCWRPDGSGVWVNGDDGVLRGLDATTGKVRSTLKGGHQPGSKIRSVWAGIVEVDGFKEEWVISGGFDKRLVVWRPDFQGRRRA